MSLYVCLISEALRDLPGCHDFFENFGGLLWSARELGVVKIHCIYPEPLTEIRNLSV
jgi:hypothetical protein